MSKRTRTLSITSGKGGVGKTTVTANTAFHLASQGKRVLILDGDLGMGNVDIMFGVRPTKTIYDVLSGTATMAEVLIEVSPKVHLIPGGSGILELQSLTDRQKRVLLDQVNAIGLDFDYMIVDTAPGIDDNVLYLNAAVHDINVILTPDPSSMADSYALIKVLNKYHRENKFSIICNQVRDEREGMILFKRLSDVASRFLFVSLDYKGCIPADTVLGRATKSQQLLLKSYPSAPSSLSLRRIADNISGFKTLETQKGGLQFFWEQLFQVA
ncbi:MAG: MinD/ParA family protein [Bdellovibrionales bacterium]